MARAPPPAASFSFLNKAAVTTRSASQIDEIRARLPLLRAAGQLKVAVWDGKEPGLDGSHQFILSADNESEGMLHHRCRDIVTNVEFLALEVLFSRSSQARGVENLCERVLGDIPDTW